MSTVNLVLEIALNILHIFPLLTPSNPTKKYCFVLVLSSGDSELEGSWWPIIAVSQHDRIKWAFDSKGHDAPHCCTMLRVFDLSSQFYSTSTNTRARTLWSGLHIVPLRANASRFWQLLLLRAWPNRKNSSEYETTLQDLLLLQCLFKLTVGILFLPTAYDSITLSPSTENGSYRVMSQAPWPSVPDPLPLCTLIFVPLPGYCFRDTAHAQQIQGHG